MKKLFSRFLMAAAVMGLTVSPASAQQVPLPGIDNTGFGTTSAEFLMIGAGARGAALGGGYAAIADDIEALYWNPAGAALMTRPGVAVSTYEYVAETRYSWVGVAFPMGGGERVIGFHRDFQRSFRPEHPLLKLPTLHLAPDQPHSGEYRWKAGQCKALINQISLE